MTQSRRQVDTDVGQYRYQRPKREVDVTTPVTPEQLAEARHVLGQQLATLRDTAGLTQAQLAKLTGYTRSTIANLETGRSSQPRTSWTRYDQLLNAAGSLLAGYDQYATLTAQQRQQTAQERERQRTAKIDQYRHATTYAPGPSDHDAGLGLPFDGTPPAFTDDSDRVRRALDRPAGVDLVTVAYLRQAVQRIDARYDRAPSLALVGEAGRQHERAVFLCANAMNGAVRRDLLTAVAESAILMGQLVWDGSQRQDSENAVRYFDQAIDAARQIGHRLIEARALLRKSFLALYGRKDPRSGLELAAAAGDTATRSSQVVTGLALLHVAEAHAMAGQRRSCEKALTDAEAHLARAEPADAASELFSPTHVSRLAGSCYLFLGEHDKSQHLLEVSLDSGPAAPTKSSTIAAANLALACIRQRKIDEAVAALHRAVDGIALTRGGGGINLAFTAGRALHGWRQDPAVREVHDRLWELMTIEGGHR